MSDGDTLMDEELSRRDSSNKVNNSEDSGFRAKFRSKKESFDKFREKRALSSENKRRTRELQSKLDRAAALEKAKANVKVYKEIRAIEKAKRVSEKVKAYEKKQKYDSSVMGKVAKGFSHVSNNFNSPVSSRKSGKKYDSFGQTFGGRSMFDDSFVGRPKNKKKGKKGSEFDIFRL